MGLSLEVGILADQKANDEEGFEWHADTFQRLNSYLATLGLPLHNEPHDCQVWSGDMLSYSGLHDVRRIAAYLDSHQPLPAPSTGEAADDPCLKAYYACVDGQRPCILARLFGSPPNFRRQFDHLIVHSDAEGYYLPVDFRQVLFPPESLKIPGGMVGSVPRLFAELQQIAQALKIPDNISPDSDELSNLIDEPSSTGERWQLYPRESYGCLMLLDGCRRATTAGAALVFL